MPTKKFQLIGADLCLDFCNTLGGKRGVRTREYLNSYDDFLSWSRQASLLNQAQGQALARQAEQLPEGAERALARGIKLREAIYRVFLAVVAGKAPATADLAQLNSELAPALGRLRVEPVRGPVRFALKWANGDVALDHPLGAVARAAAHLLTNPDSLARVRQCQGDNCGWLFIDSSKNQSRCWCDMRDCGNRAKVRRHRLKQRRVKLIHQTRVP